MSLAAVLKKKVKKVVAIIFLHQPDAMNGVDVRWPASDSISSGVDRKNPWHLCFKIKAWT